MLMSLCSVPRWPKHELLPRLRPTLGAPADTSARADTMVGLSRRVDTAAWVQLAFAFEHERWIELQRTRDDTELGAE
jgi:hypothetical protein